MTTEKLKFQACLSRESDHWATPKYIYEQIKRLGFHDPCPLHSETDGLTGDWPTDSFVNPPYSKLRAWVSKSIQQHQKNGIRVILLIPARTDTKAFRDLWQYGAKITFITGRLRFNESNPAPFPSMLVELTGGGANETVATLTDRDDVKIV